MNPFLELIFTLIDLYKLVLIVWIILSWLISFNIVNRYQPFVSKLYQFLEQITEPTLKYLRKYVPLVGSIDITPIILFILLNFIKSFVIYYAL